MYENNVLACRSERNDAYSATADSLGLVHVRSYNAGATVDIDLLRRLVAEWDAWFDTAGAWC